MDTDRLIFFLRRIDEMTEGELRQVEMRIAVRRQTMPIGVLTDQDIDYIVRELRGAGFKCCAAAAAAGWIVTSDKDARTRVDAILAEDV